MFKIAPSLMCANLLDLGQELHDLERASIDYFHIDVMDGHFVPNLGLSFDIVRQVRSITSIPLDIHLMVTAPEDYIALVAEIGIQHVSFHIEAARNPLRLARALRGTGSKAGIALNPATPAAVLQYLLPEIDYVLIMTVEPGFAGQVFIPSMYGKVREVRALLDATRPGIPIEVDGNLNVESSACCVDAGATILVGGTSSVFRRENGTCADCVAFRSEVERRLAEPATTEASSAGAPSQ